MTSALPVKAGRNLFLAFDAFGTLFRPNVPIPQAYAQAALRHGVHCASRPENGLTEHDVQAVKKAFGRSFKRESAQHPNYGKAADMGASKWWRNVIRGTFAPFLQTSQEVPEALVGELWKRYSTREGYGLFPDVLPFFTMLRDAKHVKGGWPWDTTIVAVITNSDDRVASILDSFGLTIGAGRLVDQAQKSDTVLKEADISFMVTSYDVGSEKPDRQIFDAACQMLEATFKKGHGHSARSGETFTKLYVGDDLENDYFGARSAGWESLLLFRDGHDEHVMDQLRRNRLETVQMTVNVDGVDEVKPVHMCSNLMALREWAPNQSDGC